MQKYVFITASCASTHILTFVKGDLGHTDLQEDLEFHSSSMRALKFQYCSSILCILDFEDPQNRNKIQPDTSSSFLNNGSSSRNNTSTKRLLWTIQFYAQFFDVDTAEVIKRCWAALYPRANFLDVLEGNPDLYGPFWIATTVVFILFLTGTISWKLANTGQAHYSYDFSLLSGMLDYGRIRQKYTDIVQVLPV
jgi:hypothetical protein